jgi:peroxiredoxin
LLQGWAVERATEEDIAILQDINAAFARQVALRTDTMETA